uniref:Uncharacterized protein n=1 Tax=Siphoviridae sp. ctv4j104 TaxID=2826510 RepID=A0A8S5M9V4_9CAUD|nr:MAG TPA: hypothetical protein [Siphoviridae sp. ctv4j104]
MYYYSVSVVLLFSIICQYSLSSVSIPYRCTISPPTLNHIKLPVTTKTVKSSTL